MILKVFFYCGYEGMSMGVYVHMIAFVYRGPNRVLDPLALEIKAVENRMTYILRTEHVSSEWVGCTLNCWSISSNPGMFLSKLEWNIFHDLMC